MAGCCTKYRWALSGSWRPAPSQKQRLKVLIEAAGNGAPIGGLKVTTANGWFAARPSGTEAICKIYAESFVSPEHLERIFTQAEVCLQ